MKLVALWSEQSSPSNEPNLHFVFMALQRVRKPSHTGIFISSSIGRTGAAAGIKSTCLGSAAEHVSHWASAAWSLAEEQSYAEKE